MKSFHVKLARIEYFHKSLVKDSNGPMNLKSVLERMFCNHLLWCWYSIPIDVRKRHQFGGKVHWCVHWCVHCCVHGCVHGCVHWFVHCPLLDHYHLTTSIPSHLARIGNGRPLDSKWMATFRNIRVRGRNPCFY